MADPKIMYVCQPCYENAPEACGRFDRKELRVLPDGTWVCSECHEHAEDLGLGSVPGWSKLLPPPAHTAARFVLPPVYALTTE